MEQSEIICMALEVGVKEYGPLTRNWSFGLSQLKRFAALVAAHEREKLLKIVLDDTYAMTFQTFGQYRTAIANLLRESK